MCMCDDVMFGWFREEEEKRRQLLESADRVLLLRKRQTRVLQRKSPLVKIRLR